MHSWVDFNYDFPLIHLVVVCIGEQQSTRGDSAKVGVGAINLAKIPNA